MGGLWGDTSKHVGTGAHVGRDRTRGKWAVREMGVVLEAAHTVLKLLQGRVTSAIAHTILIGKFRVVASAANVGNATLRKVRVMSVGKTFLVAVDRENWGVLHASHGLAWGEGRDLAGAATVGGRDAAEHVVRATIRVGECGYGV